MGMLTVMHSLRSWVFSKHICKALSVNPFIVDTYLNCIFFCEEKKNLPQNFSKIKKNLAALVIDSIISILHEKLQF